MNQIERAEQAAKKTAERLRKARLADAEIRLRAATRQADRATDREIAATEAREQASAAVRAIEAEIAGLTEVKA